MHNTWKTHMIQLIIKETITWLDWEEAAEVDAFAASSLKNFFLESLNIWLLAGTTFLAITLSFVECFKKREKRIYLVIIITS